MRFVLSMAMMAAVFLPGSTTAQSGPAPDRCIQGFVWRQADSTDHVCVTPQTRIQTAADNAQQGRMNANGTCIQGFVWREADPNDHVCVTPYTRTQTAADNRAAPSRTAPGQIPGPPAPPSIAGSWSTYYQDNGFTIQVTVTIAPGAARGTYTIHGVWVPVGRPDPNFPNGGDWGTAPLVIGEVTDTGFSATATLHGFYPTLHVWLEVSKGTMILKERSNYVESGVEKVGRLISMTLRPMYNQ